MIALAVLLLSAPVAQQDAIELEWKIRRYALAGGPFLELTAVFDEDDWREREARYEVVRRRRLVGIETEDVPVRDGLSDEHPNVRARALSTLTDPREFRQQEGWTALDQVARPSTPGSIWTLAADPLPDVRIELVRAMTRARATFDNGVMQRFLLDPDTDVSDSVRQGFWSFGVFGRIPRSGDLDDVHGWQVTTLMWTDRTQGPRAFADALALFTRARRDPKIYAALSRSVEAEDRIAGEKRARLALLEAIRASITGELDHDVLLSGWLAPLEYDFESGEREREQVRLLHAGARSGGLGLATRFIREARDVANEERDSRPLLKDARALYEGSDAVEALLFGAIEAAPAGELARALLDSGLSDDHCRLFWERLTVVAETWDADVLARWLAPSREAALREAVAHVVADSLAETDDDSAAAALVPLLADDSAALREIAFRALARRESPERSETALRAAWNDYGLTEKLVRLALLSREREPVAFRQDLLDLGDASRTRTGSVIELLGEFVADEEVEAKLTEWLFEDTDAIARMDESEEERARREGRARGIVRALHECGGEARAAVMARALAATVDTSIEVAKTAAWSLGRLDGGGDLLEPYLDDAIVQRVRIEAALALAYHEDDALAKYAEEALWHAYEKCDGDLRARIIRCFGTLESETSGEHLLTVMEYSNEVVERIAAVSAIEARVTVGTLPGNVGRYCVSRAPDLETQRAAIAMAGRHCDVITADVLIGLLQRSLGEDDADGLLLHDELLPALAGCDVAVELAATEILRAPLERAAYELGERFRGRRLPATEFTYRGEIEAFARLARDRRTALIPLDEIHQLDGRLVFALAEAARTAGDDPETRRLAARLYRVARVALEGEAPTDRQRLSIVEARARLWQFAGEDEDWPEYARRSNELYQDWICGRIEARDFETVFGVRDRDAGRDPVARLESAILHSRAMECLRTAEKTTGEARREALEAARRCAREARDVIGHSKSARLAQEKLERALE